MKDKIIKVILFLSIVCNLVIVLYNISIKKMLNFSNEKYDKFKKYYQLYNQWIANNNNDIKIENYFIDRNFNNIAIYGNGEIGARLYENLKNTNISVRYFIDKKANDISFDMDKIKVKAICDLKNCDKVDIIVITPIHQYEEIKKELEEFIGNTPIISIEDIFN